MSRRNLKEHEQDGGDSEQNVGFYPLPDDDGGGSMSTSLLQGHARSFYRHLYDKNTRGEDGPLGGRIKRCDSYGRMETSVNSRTSGSGGHTDIENSPLGRSRFGPKSGELYRLVSSLLDSEETDLDELMASTRENNRPLPQKRKLGSKAMLPPSSTDNNGDGAGGSGGMAPDDTAANPEPVDWDEAVWHGERSGVAPPGEGRYTRRESETTLGTALSYGCDGGALEQVLGLARDCGDTHQALTLVVHCDGTSTVASSAVPSSHRTQPGAVTNTLLPDRENENEIVDDDEDDDEEVWMEREELDVGAPDPELGPSLGMPTQDPAATSFIPAKDPRLARLKQMQRDQMKAIWRKITYGFSEGPPRGGVHSPLRRAKSALDGVSSPVGGGSQKGRSSSISPTPNKRKPSVGTGGRKNKARLPALPQIAKGLRAGVRVYDSDDAFMKRRQSLIATIESPKMPSRHDLIEALRAAKKHFLSIPLRSVAELVPLPYESLQPESFWLSSANPEHSAEIGPFGSPEQSNNQRTYTGTNIRGRGDRMMELSVRFKNEQQMSHPHTQLEGYELLQQQGEEAVLLSTLAASVSHCDVRLHATWLEVRDQLNAAVGINSPFPNSIDQQKVPGSPNKRKSTHSQFDDVNAENSPVRSDTSVGLQIRSFGIIPKSSPHDIFSPVKYVILSTEEDPFNITIALASDPLPTARYAGSTYTPPADGDGSSSLDDEFSKSGMRQGGETTPPGSPLSTKGQEEQPAAKKKKKRDCGDVAFLSGATERMEEARAWLEENCVQGKEMMWYQHQEKRTRVFAMLREVVDFMEAGLALFVETETARRRALIRKHHQGMDELEGIYPCDFTPQETIVATEDVESLPIVVAAEIWSTYSDAATLKLGFNRWTRFLKKRKSQRPLNQQIEMLVQRETLMSANARDTFGNWRPISASRMAKPRKELDGTIPVHRWTTERATVTAATLSKVLREIGCDPQTAEIKLVGHSTGGAIATVVAMVWNSVGASSADFLASTVRCVSSPKVFPERGIELVESLGIDYRHYAVAHDPIVVLPQSYSSCTSTVFELRDPGAATAGIKEEDEDIKSCSRLRSLQEEHSGVYEKSPKLPGQRMGFDDWGLPVKQHTTHVSCLALSDFITPTAEFGTEARKIHNLEHARYTVEGHYPSPFVPRNIGNDGSNKKSTPFSVRLVLQAQQRSATAPFNPQLQTFETIAGSIPGCRRVHQLYLRNSANADIGNQIQSASGSNLRSVFSPAMLSVLSDTHEMLARRAKSDMFVTQASRISKESLLGICVQLQPHQPLGVIAKRLQKFPGGKSFNQAQFIAWCATEFLHRPGFLHMFLTQGFGWNFDGSAPQRQMGDQVVGTSNERQPGSQDFMATSGRGGGRGGGGSGILFSPQYQPKQLDMLYPELLLPEPESDESDQLENSATELTAPVQGANGEWTPGAKMAIRHIFAHYSRVLPNSPFDIKTGSVPTASFACLGVMLSHSGWPLPMSIHSFNQAATLELEAEHLKRPRAGLLNFSGEVTDIGFRWYWKIILTCFGERFLLERFWILGYNEVFQHSITRGGMRNIHSRGGTQCPCSYTESDATRLRKQEEVEFRRWVAHHVEESQLEMIRMSRAAWMKKIHSIRGAGLDSLPIRKKTLARMGREQDKGIADHSLGRTPGAGERSKPSRLVAIDGPSSSAGADVYAIKAFSNSQSYNSTFNNSVQHKKQKKEQRALTKDLDGTTSLKLKQIKDKKQNEAAQSLSNSVFSTGGLKRPASSHKVPPKPESKPRGPSQIGAKLNPIKNTAPSVAKAYSSGPVRILNADQQRCLQ